MEQPLTEGPSKRAMQCISGLGAPFITTPLSLATASAHPPPGPLDSLPQSGPIAKGSCQAKIDSTYTMDMLEHKRQGKELVTHSPKRVWSSTSTLDASAAFPNPDTFLKLSGLPELSNPPSKLPFSGTLSPPVTNLSELLNVLDLAHSILVAQSALLCDLHYLHAISPAPSPFVGVVISFADVADRTRPQQQPRHF